jgi:hypothetical protein
MIISKALDKMMKNQENHQTLRILETLGTIREVINQHHEKEVNEKREASPLNLETAQWTLQEEKLMPK